MWARILRWPKRHKRIGDAVMIHACARDATRDGRLYLSFSFVVVGRSHDDALHYDSDISSHTRSTLPVTTHTSPFSHSLLHLSSDFIIIIISSSSSAHTHTHTQRRLWRNSSLQNGGHPSLHILPSCDMRSQSTPHHPRSPSISLVSRVHQLLLNLLL